MIVPLNWVDGVQQLIQVAVTQGDHIYILGMNRITGIQPNITFSIRLNRLVQVAESIVTPFIYKG